jgi:hypothetical protein
VRSIPSNPTYLITGTVGWEFVGGIVIIIGAHTRP